MSLLIDTGASICLLKKSVLINDIKIYPTDIFIKGIDSKDGDTLKSLGFVNLKLKFGENYIMHKFYIFDDLQLPYDGIIGTDLFIAYNCKLNYNTNSLEIKNYKTKLLFNEPSYIIKPRSETVIECTVENPEIKEGMILDKQVAENVFISNCLVKVKPNKRINITVLNTTEKPININSNLNIKLNEIPSHNIKLINNCNNVTERTEHVLNSLRTSHLNYEENKELLNLCSQYSDIFHLPDDKLSCTNALNHQIKTNSNIPINTKSYRFPQCHKEEVNKQINKMLDQDIIQHSISPWSSPIWVVPKKLDASGEKKWRVVIDYRKLNDITIGESYPIPQISEILDQLGNSKYFSTLDLASGFHQIPIASEDADKTAFSIPEGHFQFKRMPFGLKNAPATFQKLMNTVLSGLQGIHCYVYLDDIVIYSFDLNTHIEKLQKVFDRLRYFNLKLQPDKCEFLRREVNYLGHIITDEGVKPNPEKVKAVRDFPIPRTQKDIKSFLGLISYYRRFIPNFSLIAKPLTSLLKKDAKFVWNNEQQLAFETLKNKLLSAPILSYPDFTKPFILTCDASNYAISAILSQGEIGKDRPIAFGSRTLNKAELNYSTTEKECLAIVFGTKLFRPYVYGRTFTIVTDHKPLQWLFNCKDPGSRLVRWRLKLEEYSYTIKYKKGKINANADALSRYPVNPITIFTNNINPVSQNTEQEILDIDRDLDELLISPPSFRLDDVLANPELQPLDIECNDTPPPLENINSPVNEPSTIINQEVIDISSPNYSLNDDDYSIFCKTMSDKKENNFNTQILEHNESLMKSSLKTLLIPTSIDFDDSNPYIEQLLGNIENSEHILEAEKQLHSYLNIESNNKTYLLLFTRVHHFDEARYNEIFETLKNVRNKMVIFGNVQEIGITDFKNPFEKHNFTKIYNILLYLFHNTGIKIHIYHNKIIYPSPSEVKKILLDNHDIPIAGHLGSIRMYNRIKDMYYWKGMRNDIDNYVKACKKCQENKALRKINRAPMIITSTSTAPWQRLSLDVVGPLPESGIAKLKYILTLQDDLTKFSVAYPIRSTTAEETSECLLHFISMFGIPKIIVTDQGTNFTSELFKKTCQFLKTKQLWSSPYHPQTQGALERSHSTLKEYLKSYVNEGQTDWPRYVYTAMLAYNTSVHSTTNYTPYELMYGHRPIIPNSIFEDTPGATYPEYIKMLQNRLKYSREKAIENIKQSKNNSKKYYDTRTRPRQYKVGEYVYLKNHLRLRKSLSPIWKGPYKIVKILGNNTLSLLINRRHVTHHYDQVKPAEMHGDS